MTELPQSDVFWMVCRKPTGPQSTTQPRTRYLSFGEAMASAQKLAKENGAQFHVLETVATALPGGAMQESLL